MYPVPQLILGGVDCVSWLCGPAWSLVQAVPCVRETPAAKVMTVALVLTEQPMFKFKVEAGTVVAVTMAVMAVMLGVWELDGGSCVGGGGGNDGDGGDGSGGGDGSCINYPLLITNYPQNLMAQNNTFIISWFCGPGIQAGQGCNLPGSLPRRKICFRAHMESCSQDSALLDLAGHRSLPRGRLCGVAVGFPLCR